MNKFLLVLLVVLVIVPVFGQEAEDSIDEGFNQLEQFILQIREDNKELIDKNQSLADGFDMLEDLAWAQGNEINRIMELNKNLEKVNQQKDVVFQLTLKKMKYLKIGLSIGIPVAVIGGGVLGFLIAK